jgi:hypothetical protein
VLKFDFKAPVIKAGHSDSLVLDNAVRDGARILVWKVRELTPTVSGKVRLDWRYERFGKGWRVFNDNKVALFLEEGTGIYGPKHLPIPIQAKKKRALRFEGTTTIPASESMSHFRSGLRAGQINPTYRKSWDAPMDGVVYRRRVLVKGIRSRHYFAWAKEQVVPQIKEMIRTAARIKINEELFSGSPGSAANLSFAGSSVRKKVVLPTYPLRITK